MRAAVFGASGDLAGLLGQRLLADGWQVDLITRACRREPVEQLFDAALSKRHARLFSVENRYSEFVVAEDYDACFMAQALFVPKPLVAMDSENIENEIEIGLTDVIRLTRNIVFANVKYGDRRRNFCYIGSTSAYAGFRNTSVYCAVKHGLLGFVRAMNDEYAQTDSRFWLFSMGTMNTGMGAKVTGQDPASYLDPRDVAARIVAAISNPSNIFEPEIIMRRRTIRLLES